VFGGRATWKQAPAIGRHNYAAEKPHPAARKNRAQRVAFGLPQDSHMQLMFEACAKRGSELSAFHGVGFYVERGVAPAARHPRMRRKRLNGRPNFPGCAADGSRCALKRLHRHGFPHQTMHGEAAKARCLPPVCRNVSSFRRKTPPHRSSESRRAPAHPSSACTDKRFCSRFSQVVSRISAVRCRTPQIKRRPLRSAFRVSHRAARGQKPAAKTHSE
jgi:hypothetical protein